MIWTYLSSILLHLSLSPFHSNSKSVHKVHFWPRNTKLLCSTSDRSLHICLIILSFLMLSGQYYLQAHVKLILQVDLWKLLHYSWTVLSWKKGYRIYLWSLQECDYLRAIASPRLQVSTVVDTKTGKVLWYPTYYLTLQVSVNSFDGS